MDTKKIVFAALAGTVVYFLLGWLIYGMMLMDVMASHPGSVTGYMRTDQEMMGQMGYMVAANFAFSSLLAIVFGRWAGINTLVGGLLGGGLIGFLASASFDCMGYATSNLMSRTGIAIDVSAFTFISAIAGAVIALVLGMGKKA